MGGELFLAVTSESSGILGFGDSSWGLGGVLGFWGFSWGLGGGGSWVLAGVWGRGGGSN